MQVVQALERLGGVSDAGTLRRLSSRRRMNRALRKGQIVRDIRGRYALPTADQALRAANALSGVVSHESAATHWGWETKRAPELPVVTVPRNRKVDPVRRAGVSVRWGNLEPHEVVHPGVTAPGRTVMDCSKAMPFDAALAIADSALRHGNVTKPRMLQLADRMAGPGRAKCLRVARHADGRAANPFESVLRAISLDIPGLELVPQVAIQDRGLDVRPDLVDEHLRLVVEADSFAWHGKRKALKRDCERYNALSLRQWTVLRFSWEHVMFEPGYVADCLRAAAQGGAVRRAEPRQGGQIPA